MESSAESIRADEKAPRVRAMFAQIAPRYDLLNHLLSLNADRRWRPFALAQVKDRLARPGAVALDLCCGTADLALELGELAQTYGLDFCHPMLELGLKKTRSAAARVELLEGDALCAPIADATFDVVTIAFGLRNLDSVEGGLREIYRLLKCDGRCAVLEFSHPQLPLFRSLFQFYFTRVLPLIGNALSGSQFAYQYLPDSVQRFPDREALAQAMRSVGFSQVKYYNLFGGAAALHLGDKGAPRQ